MLIFFSFGIILIISNPKERKIYDIIEKITSKERFESCSNKVEIRDKENININNTNNGFI